MIPPKTTGQSAVLGGGLSGYGNSIQCRHGYTDRITVMCCAAVLVFHRELQPMQYFARHYKMKGGFLWFVVFTIQDEVIPLYLGFPMCLTVTIV